MYINFTTIHFIENEFEYRHVNRVALLKRLKWDSPICAHSDSYPPPPPQLTKQPEWAWAKCKYLHIRSFFTMNNFLFIIFILKCCQHRLTNKTKHCVAIIDFISRVKKKLCQRSAQRFELRVYGDSTVREIC